MTIPGQTITRRDGGLGLVGSGEDRILLIGDCSSGTDNTLYQLASSQAYRSALGQGLVVESAAWILDNAKEIGFQGSVDILVANGSVAGAAGTVSQSGTGPAVSVAGASRLPFVVRIVVTLGGALGAGRFKYSLDGGNDYTDPITIPSGGTYVLPNTGLTLTFASGTYVLSEVYSFTCTAPSFVAADLANADDALLASDYTWSLIFVICQPASASVAALLAAGAISMCSGLVSTNRYPRVIVPCGADTAANIATAFDAVESALHARVAGTVPIPLKSGWAGWRKPTLPYIVEFARRCAAVAPATSPAWNGLEDDIAKTLGTPSIDEYKEGDVLHQYRVIAPRTYRNKAGVYPTCALTGAASGSDFKHLQWCRVIDIMSSVIDAKQETLINEAGPTLIDGTGRIAPEWAAQIKADVDQALDDAVGKKFTSEGRKGYVSGFNYQPDQTNNLLTTGLFKSTCQAVPLANISQIATDLGFTREIS